jgi:hypothetical protein
MKTLSIINLTAVALLVSTTVAGALLQQPHRDTPYIPANLVYVPISGGISVVNLETNQTIPGVVSNDHIDVYTTAQYQNFKYIAGENVSIPLYFKFISDTKNSTIITIDPNDPMTLHVEQSLGPGKGGIMLNDYFHYTPEVVFKLQNGEMMKVTLNIYVPKGLWTYDYPSIIPFNLVGLDSNAFIVTRFSGEIDL